MYDELIMFLSENQFQKIKTKDNSKETWKFNGKTIVNDLSKNNTGFINVSFGTGNSIKTKINLSYLTKKETLTILSSIVNNDNKLMLTVLSSLIVKEKLKLYEENQ